MAHYIPVFFFPVDNTGMPDVLGSWEDVIPLLETALARPVESRLRTSHSRNWWHQDVLQSLCHEYPIEGLNFILSEVASLDAQKLRTASQALTAVMFIKRSGLPPLNNFERPYFEDLRQLDKDGAAIHLAEPCDEVKGEDNGLQAMVDFHSFLKSLADSINQCLLGEQSLLYIMPTP